MLSDPPQSSLLSFSPAKTLALPHGETSNAGAGILFQQGQDRATRPSAACQHLLDLGDRRLAKMLSIEFHAG